MPDYDVSAEGLASPPVLAPVTTYYPAALVKNRGVHPANVTGYIRIYAKATGLLVAQHQVARNNIQPGETVSVPSSVAWTLLPADIGKQFIFNGAITAPIDNVPGNNNFGPVTVTVTGEAPPPPPIQTHAPQHENGGADELVLTGLSGKLAEKQDPTEHASAHEDGGADQLDVSDLEGELADPQTPKTHAGTHAVGGSDPVVNVAPAAHHLTHEPGGVDVITGVPAAAHKASHENGGTDELSVAGLSGELADRQPPTNHGSSTHQYGQEDEFSVEQLSGVLKDPQNPKAHHLTHEPGGDDEISGIGTTVHGNEKHDPAMVTFEALGESLADYQLTEDKDTANGYAGLDVDGLLKVVEFPPGIERTTNKGEASGYAPLDGNALVPVANLPATAPAEHGASLHDATVEAVANKDAAGGYCGLDVNSQLPSSRVSSGAATIHQVLAADGSGGTSWEDVPVIQSHGNEAHTSAMELQSAKGAANGYAELDANAMLPWSRHQTHDARLDTYVFATDDEAPSSGIWTQELQQNPNGPAVNNAVAIGQATFRPRFGGQTALKIGLRAFITDANGTTYGLPAYFYAETNASVQFGGCTLFCFARRAVANVPVTNFGIEVWHDMDMVTVGDRCAQLMSSR